MNNNFFKDIQFHMLKYYITLPVFLGVFFILCLSGCNLLPAEAPIRLPIHPTEPTERSYQLFPAAVGDVKRYLTTNASFIPIHEESLNFGLSRQFVTGIYVSRGDTVNEGDVIASVNRPYLLEQKNNIRRNYETTLLLIRQLEELFAFEIRASEKLNTLIDDESYLRERANLLYRLESQKKRLDYLSNQYNNQFLKTNINGIVTFALDFTQGLVVSNFENIATIINPREYFFGVLGNPANYLSIGDDVILTVNGDDFSGIVVDISDYDIPMSRLQAGGFPFRAFIKLNDHNEPTISWSNFALLKIITEEASNVLYVPNSTINRTHDSAFVYVMNFGIREIRFVETGVTGNSTTEIKSGLEEGEMIIID